MNRSAWAVVVAALGLAAGLAAALTAAPAGMVTVKAKAKPADAWKEHPTRTLAGLAGFAPTPAERAVKLSPYGGWAEERQKATGFFYAKKLGGRWWLIDPEGCRFLHVAMVSVGPGKSANNKAALDRQFGTPERWAEATTGLLRAHGFNGLGAWSSDQALRGVKQPLVYCPIWNFMSGFGKAKKVTYQKPGHAGYPGDCIPVFHPDFPAYCAEQAKALAATKDDPWLLGHFSDNEMPCATDWLDRYLKLPAEDPTMGPNRRAAEAWLAKQRGAAEPGAAAPTDAERKAFIEHVWDTYYRITTTAMRQADPNHLMLGSRLHGGDKGRAEIWRAAGRHLDVVAVNYYGAWTPKPTDMSNWVTWSGKPFLVTEWYVKGDDAGFKNSTGAGWIVPTQADRGRFYQNFTLGLLESKACVGWHWFKYMDNDPEDLTTDPSNRDSNKGVVTIRYEPYRAVLDAMKELNREVYPLTRWFDGQ